MSARKKPSTDPFDPMTGVCKQEAETRLLESERRYRILFEQAPLGVFHVDENGTILSCNDTFVKIIGSSRQTLLGLDMNTLPDHAIVRELNKALAGGKGFYEDVYHSVTAAKSTPVKVYFAPLVSENNDIIGCMGIVEDITERKRAEAEKAQMAQSLRESEERFSKAFKSSPAAQVISEIDSGRLIDVNNRWLEMIGTTFAAIAGKTSIETCLYADPSERGRLIAKLRAHGQFTDEPIELNTQAGKRIMTRWSAVIITLSGKQVMLSMLYDETERKKAEADHEKLQLQLYQSQKIESIGQLAGGIAHDFNNMLSVIMGYTEMAIANVDPAEPIHDHLREVYRAATHSASITQQLLAFARKQNIAPKTLDLNRSVEKSLTMLRRLIGEDIDLSWRPCADLWPVRMDPAQVDQVLINLCVNARDAVSGSGQVVIETGNADIDDSWREAYPFFVPGAYAVLTVSDNGHGMDEKTLSCLFEPFFTTKGVGEGTGLGLSTVYGIVKQNRGFILVHSEPGKGACFRIYLPRHDGDIKNGRKSVTAASKGKRETVLVTEDEASMLRLVAKMLESLGYRVFPANSPGEALDLAGQYTGEIDLLLTDMVMPAMSGRELARRLQAICPAMRTLYMTGYAMDATPRNEVMAMEGLFIQKPFTIADLAARVRQALDDTEPGLT